MRNANVRNDLNLFLMIFPRMSLHFKLVPVQYREYEYGLLGIRGTLLNWLTSYLTSRLQYTVLNGQRSTLCSVSSGVPQGSVLGPTLFNLYTSDLVASIQSESVYMYADDTTVYCVGKTIDEVSAALNQSLKELYAWCVKNRLTPHPKKSECMLIYRGSFTDPLHP